MLRLGLTPAAISRLDILQAIFERIVIPQAVYDETTAWGFPGTQFVLQAIASGWLQVRPVATKRVYHSSGTR